MDRRVAEALEDLGGIGAEVERRGLQARNDVVADQPFHESRQTGIGHRLGHGLVSDQQAEIG
jgi:hypothetical protein